MRVKAICCALLVMITKMGYSVSSAYVQELDFLNIEDYSFSNISFYDDGAIELARQSDVIYETEGIIWSIARNDDTFLIGEGDSAVLTLIDGNDESVVYENSNFILFSDIEVSDDSVFVAGFPGGKLIELNKNYKNINEIEVQSRYIWDIVPYNDGLYLLCGNPGAVYYVEDDDVELVFSTENQDNLLKGMVIQGELYFTADSILYKISDGEAVPLAGFTTDIADFELIGDEIFLITASRDTASISGRASEQNQVLTSYSENGWSDIYSTSVLYKVELDGTFQNLFQKSGIKFLSLSLLDDKLIIGTGKDGGYYEISTDGNEAVFTSLGEGKFVKMYETDESVFAVMMYPDRVVEISENYSEEGYLVSSVFDTGNVSAWGVPFVKDELYPDSAISYRTRTGNVWDKSMWEGWEDVTFDGVQSSNGRYIQFKVEMSSDGQYSPLLNSLSIPYLENNLTPKITNISYSYNSAFVTVKWAAEDANNDTLIYDLYIALDESDWVKMNDEPLEETAYNLYFTSFPTGLYRAKVVVSDEWSNTEDEYETAYYTGSQYFIDNENPEISEIKIDGDNGMYQVSFSATDDFLPINNAGYSVNGSDWILIKPDDLICDSQFEAFSFEVEVDEPSILQVIVFDYFGNEAVKGIFIGE